MILIAWSLRENVHFCCYFLYISYLISQFRKYFNQQLVSKIKITLKTGFVQNIFKVFLQVIITKCRYIVFLLPTKQRCCVCNYHLNFKWLNICNSLSCQLVYKNDQLFINTLHPNISMHILCTVLYASLRCWQGEFV